MSERQRKYLEPRNGYLGSYELKRIIAATASRELHVGVSSLQDDHRVHLDVWSEYRSNQSDPEVCTLAQRGAVALTLPGVTWLITELLQARAEIIARQPPGTGDARPRHFFDREARALERA